MKIQAFTDTGKVRDMNQDAYKAGLFPQDGGAWAVVCDGMGGVSGGQIASEICVNEVSSHIEKGYRKSMSMKSVKNLLVSAITAANIKVFETANENHEYRGMGTTVVAVVILNGFAAVAHVGDSRAYFLNNEIRQITRDHSVVQYLLDLGRITPEAAKTHPDRNVITRAVGVNMDVDVDVDIIPINQGETIFICTDGLYEYITPEVMFNVIKNSDNDEPAKVLLDMANEAGGKDNITVVTVEG
ncbi:MAG: Stp1/IreP family PP2C-type Ser/Thr phosphatase [Clostridia bacterium]|nr:Stp1/IreP family PP2C-type Ser/Thr phosphatase [Clostridia bacterium]